MYKKEKFTLSLEDAEAYKMGESATSIGRRNNISQTSVVRELERMGIKRECSRNKNLSTDDISAYLKGESTAEIAARTGISIPLVRKVLKQNGVELRKENQHKNAYRISPEDISAYKSGESASSIGRRNNTSSSSVIRQLKRKGVEVRTHEESMENENPYRISAKDIFLYKRGESAYSIAQRNNVGNTSVLTELRKNGIRVRGRDEATALKVQS